ncbi:MAG TPA: YCF48-related protein [Ignavibacteriaceae bacterium]|nr:YCF48-related protein [Ignavibacteriaceae bacterium]
MKTTLLGVFIALTITSQSFSQWEWLNPRPHGNANNRIAFGSNSDTYTIVGNAGIIMKTTNDGVDWNIQNSGTEVNLKDVYLSGDDGVVVGNSGTILRTSDGGTTWQSVNSGTSANLTGVAFSTSNIGIITGWDGLILRTINGGVNWNSVAIPFTRRLYGISFADANNGMIAADSGVVWRTTTGGISWNKLTIDDTLFTSFFDISYVSSSTAFTVGWGGKIFRTTNGGSTWSFIGFHEYIRWGVSFTDPNNGVVSGDVNLLVRTTDGGTTWEQAAVGTIATNFHCVRFYNSTKGVAVGEWGAIFKTDDGGITWQIITKGILPHGGSPDAVNRNSLYSVQCINTNRAVISGSSEVFMTNNAGVSWNSVVMNGYPKLNDLDFANQNIGAMIGVDATFQGSIIFRTGNGGSGWSVQYNSNSVTLNGIDLSTPTHGIAVGDGGKILRTTNGGQNWTEQIPPQPYHIYDVFLVDSLIGYTVGRYGNILKTTDGGISWNQVFSNFSYNLRGVSFYDANIGIAVGEWIVVGVSHGIIVKTTDGGSNWVSQNLDALALPLFLESVTFTDNNNWYAIGISVYNSLHTIGRIFKSQDAGVSWFEQSIPFKSTRHINAISAFDNNKLLVVGLEGMVLGTINGGGTTSVEDISNGEIPVNFTLYQNYPNPFNPSTTIQFSLPKSGDVTLKIYDILGREVATLLNETKNAGSYSVTFNASGLSTGIYFYQLSVGNEFRQTKKLVLIK